MSITCEHGRRPWKCRECAIESHVAQETEPTKKHFVDVTFPRISRDKLDSLVENVDYLNMSDLISNMVGGYVGDCEIKFKLANLISNGNFVDPLGILIKGISESHIGKSYCIHYNEGQGFTVSKELIRKLFTEPLDKDQDTPDDLVIVPGTDILLPIAMIPRHLWYRQIESIEYTETPVRGLIVKFYLLAQTWHVTVDQINLFRREGRLSCYPVPADLIPERLRAKRFYSWGLVDFNYELYFDSSIGYEKFVITEAAVVDSYRHNEKSILAVKSYTKPTEIPTHKSITVGFRKGGLDKVCIEGPCEILFNGQRLRAVREGDKLHIITDDYRKLI